MTYGKGIKKKKRKKKKHKTSHMIQQGSSSWISFLFQSHPSLSSETERKTVYSKHTRGHYGLPR